MNFLQLQAHVAHEVRISFNLSSSCANPNAEPPLTTATLHLQGKHICMIAAFASMNRIPHSQSITDVYCNSWKDTSHRKAQNTEQLDYLCPFFHVNHHVTFRSGTQHIAVLLIPIAS
jgi:hypothetical protein